MKNKIALNYNKLFEACSKYPEIKLCPPREQPNNSKRFTGAPNEFIQKFCSNNTNQQTFIKNKQKGRK